MSFDDPTPHPPGGSIVDLLARLRIAGLARESGGKVALRDIVTTLGETSFAALVLVFALLLVSPLSAIPLATTVFCLTIAAVVVQMVLGRRHVWLPGFLLDRQLPVVRLLAALAWLDKPARWLERCLRARLGLLVEPPLGRLPKLVVLSATLCSPMLEVIPGSGTSLGAAITLFGGGLLARDGLFVVLGASLAAILPLTLWLLLT
jgi:hypothetical protein